MCEQRAHVWAVSQGAQFHAVSLNRSNVLLGYFIEESELSLRDEASIKMPVVRQRTLSDHRKEIDMECGDSTNSVDRVCGFT